MTVGRQIADQNFGVYVPQATVVTELDGTIDLYPDESHGIRIDKTTYPIESGARLTDHAIVRPDTLSLEGYVSDVQIYEDSTTNLTGPARAPEAWSRIEDAAKRRIPVSVTTSLKQYENMLILSATTTRNADTGGGLRFTLVFEEVQFADTQLVALTPDQLSGPAENKSSTVDGGRKQAPQTVNSGSQLRQIEQNAGWIE